jgi:mannan endo-1,4-beta-mannosidase
MWGFWCTWGSEFVAKDIAVYSYSDQYTEEDKLKEFYENEAVITLEDLPVLTEYPIREELQ